VARPIGLAPGFDGDASRGALWAAVTGDVPSLRSLLDLGLDVNSSFEDVGGETLLSIVCQYGRRRAAKLLLARGANPNVDGGYARAPLCRAASGGYTRLMRLLVRHGARINHPRGTYTPLMAAVEHGSLLAMAYLLDEGADPDAVTSGGKSALILAFESSHVGLTPLARRAAVCALLEAGATADRSDDEGMTPLAWAVERGDQEAAGVLRAAASRPR